MVRGLRRSVLVGGVLAALMLSACGSDDDSGTAEPAEASTPATAGSGDVADSDGAASTAELVAGSTVEPVASDAPASSSAVGGGDGEVECEAISVGVLDDDPHRALFFALEEGIVDTGVVGSLDVEFLTIPALIEASQSGTFDVVEASAQIPVLARQGGVDMRVLAPAQIDLEMAQVLLAGEDVEDPAALDGGTVAIVSLGSTTTVLSQIVLGGKYGLDPAIQGGSVTWIELPFDQVASEIGRSADAGTVSHYGQWLALKDPALTALTNVGSDYRELSGDVPMPLSVFMTTGPQVEGRGACFDAARNAMDESFSYAVDNAEEVAAAVAAETSAPDPADVEEFLPVWLTEWFQFDVGGDEAALEPVTTFWQLAAEQGLIPEPPGFDEIAVRGDE